MSAPVDLETIIDGDGHIIEDFKGIAEYLPDEVRSNPAFRNPNNMFPPLDHLHFAHLMTTPGSQERTTPVGPAEWGAFLQEVGIDQTVLYPTWGLAYGKIASLDWAIAATRAYNDWLYNTYLKVNPRFKGMALIPMQEPAAAVEELRRAVTELGMVGGMIPTFGLPDHVAAKVYWPIYEEAAKLGCCLTIHGGCHSGIGLDHMNAYAPIHAIGHPYGQVIGLASVIFNGIFDRYPNSRIAFLEGGIGWFLMCLERFDRSFATHTEYHLRQDHLLGPQPGDKVSEYIQRHIDAGRLYIGCEGSEPGLGFAVSCTGSAPYVYSSDFPHEVTTSICKEEIGEVRDSVSISDHDKEAILHKNAGRLYGLSPM
jgi:predicted TIM-barrel fold metal-dependent hydrolase